MTSQTTGIESQSTTEAFEPAAIRFAESQCRPSINLLNRLRKARYMATIVSGAGKGTVDRQALARYRAKYIGGPSAARRELAELLAVAARNGVDSLALASAGMRLAREAIVREHPPEQCFLSRGHGVYPGARARIDRAKGELKTARDARERFRSESAEAKAKEDEAKAIEAEVASRKAKRFAEVRRLQSERNMRRRMLPKLKEGWRLGKLVHPSKLQPGTTLHHFVFSVSGFGSFVGATLISREFVRLNQASFTTTEGRHPVGELRDCFIADEATRTVRPVRIVTRNDPIILPVLAI